MGQLFDVRYFNCELTAAEAVRIYNGDVLGDEILRMPLDRGDVTKNLGSWTHSSPKPGLQFKLHKVICLIVIPQFIKVSFSDASIRIY